MTDSRAAVPSPDGTVRERPSRIRWRRVVVIFTIALVVAAVLRLLHFVSTMDDPGASIGIDRSLYLGATQRWLDGGSFYPDRQLAGPYAIIGAGEILYPPVALWLFVPMSYAPAILWWAIPAVLVGWSLWRLDPAPWTWPIIAFILLLPRSQELVLWGNPGIYIVAAVALGAVWQWPAVFVLVKPTLAPFALIGIRSRRWWIALGVLIAASLPLAGLWADWFRVVTNATNAGWTYSLVDVPLTAMPIVAWIGRRSDSDARARLDCPDVSAIDSPDAHG